MEIQEHGKLWEDPEEWLGRNPARAHRSRTGKGRQAAGADEGSRKMAGTLRRQHKHEALPRAPRPRDVRAGGRRPAHTARPTCLVLQPGPGPALLGPRLPPSFPQTPVGLFRDVILREEA